MRDRALEAPSYGEKEDQELLRARLSSCSEATLGLVQCLSASARSLERCIAFMVPVIIFAACFNFSGNFETFEVHFLQVRGLSTL